MFEWDDEEKRWDADHHPFTAPRDEDLHAARDRSRQGPRPRPTTWSATATRSAAAASVSTTATCRRASSACCGIATEEAPRARFGFLLDAFKYGAPPHGGIALGIDRVGDDPAPETANIRDVIAFPKNQQARDLMTGAPSVVADDQLRDLHVAVVMPPAKE